MMNPDARRSRAQGSEEENGPEPEQDRPMWKRFMLPLLLVLALLASAVAVSLSSSRDRDHDGLPDQLGAPLRDLDREEVGQTGP